VKVSLSACPSIVILAFGVALRVTCIASVAAVPAQGLTRLPETYLPKLPRMADFALWATAWEIALWPAGTFWPAYCGNRNEVVENVIEADPIAAAVSAIMTLRTEWTGTATELLDALGKVAGDRVANSKTWPDGPRALAGRLRRAATVLRKAGIDVSWGSRKGHAGARIITIVTTEATTDRPSATSENRGAPPSAPSASSAPLVSSDIRLTVGASSLPLSSAPSATINGSGAAKPLCRLGFEAGADSADDADAKFATQSAPEKSGVPPNDSAGRCPTLDAEVEIEL
jgi:hypothetical protein